jgi:hypothetical protein
MLLFPLSLSIYVGRIICLDDIEILACRSSNSTDHYIKDMKYVEVFPDNFSSAKNIKKDLGCSCQ